jgi:hypothetical protein
MPVNEERRRQSRGTVDAIKRACVHHTPTLRR